MPPAGVSPARFRLEDGGPVVRRRGLELVGHPGTAPGVSWAQARRVLFLPRARESDRGKGAPGRIFACDLLLRKQGLWTLSYGGMSRRARQALCEAISRGANSDPTGAAPAVSRATGGRVCCFSSGPIWINGVFDKMVGAGGNAPLGRLPRAFWAGGFTGRQGDRHPGMHGVPVLPRTRAVLETALRMLAPAVSLKPSPPQDSHLDCPASETGASALG